MKVSKRLFLLFIIFAMTVSAVAQEMNFKLSKQSETPFYFSVKVPDGNYKVTVTLGSPKKKAITTVRAESRRLMVENCATLKGQFKTYEFIVNKRSPRISDTKKVILKDREKYYLDWDDSLTLEFNGVNPCV